MVPMEPRPAPVLRAAHVRRSPREAFAMFTAEIGTWWPMGTHSVWGTGGTVAFEHGRVVERSADGEETLWATATAWEPGERLVLQWHAGRDADDASEVEVRFVGDEDGTRIEIEHRGWERFGTQAEERRRSYAGPAAWGMVLDAYAALADRPDMTDRPGYGSGTSTAPACGGSVTVGPATSAPAGVAQRSS